MILIITNQNTLKFSVQMHVKHRDRLETQAQMTYIHDKTKGGAEICFTRQTEIYVSDEWVTMGQVSYSDVHVCRNE